MQFFHLYNIIFFYFFCFPNIIMCILNIASAIEKVSVNDPSIAKEHYQSFIKNAQYQKTITNSYLSAKTFLNIQTFLI